MGSKKEKPVIIISILVLAVITVAILFGTGVIDFGKKSSHEAKEPGDATITDNPDTDSPSVTEVSTSADSSLPVPVGPGKYTCIIRGIDLDSCRIELYDIESGSDVEFTFTAATSVKTSYGKIIGAKLLKVGDIVDVVTSDGTKLDSVSGDSDFKTHKDVMRFSFDKSIGRITAGNNVYKYDDRLLVLDGDRFIDVDDLNSLDVISLFYRDNSVFFIKVVSSHGFLTFSGADDFIGGSVSINGNNTAYQIESNLSIPLSVGEYSVVIENLGLSASADIMIESHKSAVFDLSPFGRVPVSYGDVSFNIYPEGAILYIDGVNTYYGDPVSIPEGTHSIRVELGGYISFSGTIDVSPSGGTFNISLPPAPIKSDTPPDDLLYNNSEEADEYLDDGGEEYRDDYQDYSSGNNGFIFDDNTSDGPDRYDTDVPEQGNTSPGNASGDGIASPGDSADAGEGIATVSQGSGSGQKLRISCTEGTSVYINGTLVSKVTGGVAVCDKPGAGTVTVRLVLDGHISRTYTVSIEDDGEDAEFTFPAMVKQ